MALASKEARFASDGKARSTGTASCGIRKKNGAFSQSRIRRKKLAPLLTQGGLRQIHTSLAGLEALCCFRFFIFISQAKARADNHTQTNERTNKQTKSNQHTPSRVRPSEIAFLSLSLKQRGK